MFCKNCGKQVADGVKFCPSCGKPVGVPAAELSQNISYGNNGYQQPVNSMPIHNTNTSNNFWKVRCKRCGSENVKVDVVVEQHKTSCLMVLIYLLLACTVIGLLIVIPVLLRKRSRTVTYAVCQNCGKRWKVK